MSFCSLSYEFVISTKLSHLLGEGIFIFPTTIGLFILFMGLGSARWISENDGFSEKQLLTRFLLIEGLLTVLGACGIIALEHIVSLTDGFQTPVICGFLLVALIGFLSGQELPIVFRLVGDEEEHQKRNRRIIFFDYFASFFASVAFALILFKLLGLIKTSFFIASLNLLVFALVYFIKKDIDQKFIKKSLAIFTCLVVVMSTLWIKSEKIENHYFYKQKALASNHILLKKKFTNYQQILLFVGNKDMDIKTTIDEKEVLNNPDDYYVYAYLNGSIQFFNTLGVKTDAYHTYLIDPFLYVFEKEYKEILVLGGGDGLPARQLLQHKNINSINMVDLDGEWVNFTRTDPIMNMNSQNALNQKKLKFHTSDAFKWIARTKKRFHAVFVDFPEEYNMASIRTMSLQFMNDLKRILHQNGVFVLQGDFTEELNSKFLGTVINTAHRAGLFPLMGFKASSNQLNHFVIQIAVFKDRDTRAEYLKKYENVYLKDPRYQESISNYSHLIYQDTSKYQSEDYVSFYEPSLLKIIFQEYFEGKRL